MELSGIIISILLIVVVITIALVISNKRHHNKSHPNVEPFTPNMVGVRPETMTQKYNVIADTIQHSSQNISAINDGVTNHAYEIKFPTMLNTYVIKQIYMTGLMLDGSKFRVAVRNSADKSMRYIGFKYGNEGTGVRLSDTVDETSQQYIRMTTGQTNGNGFILDEVTDIYGNDIIGDEILLFCSNEVRTRNTTMSTRIFVTGYPDGEKYDLEYIQKNSSNITTTVDRPKLSDREFISQLDDTRPPYVITKLTLDAHNLVSNVINITSDVITGNYGSNGQNKQLLEGDRIAILFKNNYTNNTIHYPGPVEGQFIFNEAAPTLYINNTLVANQLILKVFPNNDSTTIVAREPFIIEDRFLKEIRGYTASVDDINRFKLQYNVTDIRGSINPDDVCPSADKFLSEQINSELILDTLEYQDKINQEKRKLVSHKENLLRLDEQSEDIIRLEAMIRRLESISKQRRHQTDAINTMHFTSQLEEAMKLRERLDKRLATRKENEFHTTATIRHPFDLSPDDDMRL